MTIKYRAVRTAILSFTITLCLLLLLAGCYVVDYNSRYMMEGVVAPAYANTVQSAAVQVIKTVPVTQMDSAALLWQLIPPRWRALMLAVAVPMDMVFPLPL